MVAVVPEIVTPVCATKLPSVVVPSVKVGVTTSVSTASGSGSPSVAVAKGCTVCSPVALNVRLVLDSVNHGASLAPVTVMLLRTLTVLVVTAPPVHLPS